MSVIGQELDALVDALRAEFPAVQVTRVPAHMVPPCLFVGPPIITGRTLTGWLLDVPVSVVAPGPAGIEHLEALLAGVEGLLEAAGQGTAFPQPFDAGDVQYPSYQVTVQRIAERTKE
jgi:hypothetical protein